MSKFIQMLKEGSRKPLTIKELTLIKRDWDSYTFYINGKVTKSIKDAEKALKDGKKVEINK